MLKHDKKLLQRIKEAESLEEINRLLEEGKTYSDASHATRSRWAKFAAIRTAELEDAAPPAVDIIKRSWLRVE